MPDTSMPIGLVMVLTGQSTTTSKPQVTKQSRLASFILVMPRMKSVLIGRVCFERHFATPQERRSRCMRAT